MDDDSLRVVEAEIGPELKRLAAHGFAIEDCRYDERCFGDFYVDLCRGDRLLRIIRDRSQYIVEGDRESKEKAGLWRAFDSKHEFFAALFAWIEGES